MGFTLDDSMVRVDIFKESGEWYTTKELKWDRSTSVIDGLFEHPNDTFRRCMREQMEGRYSGMWAVCLDPHEHSYPLMIKLEEN